LSDAGSEERNQLKAEMTKLESKAKAIKAELEAKKKENERAESVQTGLKNQIEALREELKASQKAYRDKMDMGLAKLEEEWQAKLDAAKEAHRLELEQLGGRVAQDWQVKLDEAAKQYEEEIKVLKNALSAEAAKASSEQSEAERLRLQLEADLREEKQGRRTDNEALKKRLEEELGQAKKAHAAELEDLRRELSSSSDSRVAQLQDQHRKAEAKLEANMAELRRTHEEELGASLAAAAAASEESSKRMLADLEARLNAAHTRAIEDLRIESASALGKLKKEMADHNEQMTIERDMMEQTLNQTLASLASTEKALGEEKSEAQRKAAAMAAERERMQRDFDLLTRQEREANQRELMGQQERHAADMRLLKDEFSEDRTRFDERLQELQAELDKMERRYQNRDSREDDLARIRALEQELVDKDELVVKTREEMMYFKREMLNREESYNVKFNSKPNVGVMQVIKSKDEGGSKGAQPGPKSSKPTHVVGGGGGGMGMGMGMGIGGGGLGISSSSSAIPPGIPGSGSSKNNAPPLPGGSAKR
jgi:hypothetical protein